MASAAFLRSLPAADALLDRIRIMAMLDAIVAPDQRSFEFHPKWSKGVKVGAYKDGSGNFFFLWSSAHGAVLRGFDHESPMSPFRIDPPVRWPGIWEGLPSALSTARDEPAFVEEEITFAFWRQPSDATWLSGPIRHAKREGPWKSDPDGAKHTLECVLRPIRTFARDVYELELGKQALAALESGRLERATIEAINEDFDEEAVRKEAKLCAFSILGRPPESK